MEKEKEKNLVMMQKGVLPDVSQSD